MRIVPTITMLAITFAAIPCGKQLPQALAAGPAKASAELEREVHRLIDDLGGATRDGRAQAEQRLLEIGPAALPHLPAAERVPSNSVREAVRRIRIELERQQARESVLPARITLAGKQPLKSVLEEIQRQTGNVVDGQSLPQGLLEQGTDLDASGTPFWQVMDDLAARLNLAYEYDAALHGLKITAPAGVRPLSPSVGYAGAFRIEVSQATRHRAAGRVGANLVAQPAELLRLTARVRPEPRLRPLFLQFATRQIVVRSGDRELAPFSPDASYELSFAEGTNQSPIQVDYVIPAGFDVRGVSLKGKMRCMTAAGAETFRFSGVDHENFERAGVSRRRGGVTVTLNRVVRAKGEMRIRIAVAYEAGGAAFESHRTWFLHNNVHLEDPAGRTFPLNGGTETVQQGEGSIGIEYRFIKLPDPLGDLAFVYVAPTLIVDVPLEFEIESVPVAGRSAPAGAGK